MNLPEGSISNNSPDLRDYLEIIKIRKWAVILILGLVFVSATVYSLTRTPIYVSEARVQVRPLGLTMIDSFNTGLNMETERALASSPIVARIATDEMGAAGDVNDLLEDLSVSVETDTEILVFQYSDPDPRVAQRATQSFAEAYLTSRLEQAEEDLSARAQPLQDRLNDRRERLNDTEARLQAATNPARIGELEARRSLLVNRIAILEEQLDELLTQGAQNVGQIVKPAELPEAPASPKHVVNLAMAFVLGIALGVSAAFLMERLDDGLRGRADLELHAGVPVLAVVPSVRNWRKREQTMMVWTSEPHKAAVLERN